MIAPALTLAGPDLTPGEDAVVANTNGDGATLRSDPGRDAAAISNVPEGTSVQITDGPVPAADGSLWYQVAVDGVPGYISVDYVEGGAADDAAEPSEADGEAEDPLDETTETEPAQDEPAVQGPAAATTPWQQPVAFGVVVNTTGSVPVDGITCRADAYDGAPIITELWEGNALEVTGEQVFDGAGGGWYPINCAGVGGFVSSAYVALDALAEEAPAVEAETTEDVVEETVTEEPAVEKSVTTEETVTTEIAVEVEEPVTTEVVEEVVTDTTTTEVVEESAPVDEVTTEEVAEAVTEEVVEEPAVTTEEVTTDDAAVTTETEVTEEATTDTEITTDTAAETQPEVAEEVATEAETETQTESTPAEETVEATTETVTETETETVTESETATETEQAPVTDATEEAATEVTADVTETTEATEQATDEATTEPTEEATEQAAETPATPAPPPAFDASQAIGTAEVQGTGGDGLKCHTAADAGAPTITVLPEGANVIVMAAPRGDWLNIVCGGQLGFGQVRYLYSGGAAPSDFQAEDTGGSVRVQGTGGGGLNCRASASLSGARITLVPEGATLTIRGLPQGSWLPVVCAGRNGYVYVDYVSAPLGGGSSSTPQFTTASTSSATVVGTNGDGVRCRTGATTTSSIITVLAEGTRVTLRGTPSNGWAPVVCAGRAGYVSATYLKIVASDGSTSGGTSGGGTTSGTATVTGTGSGGLNCRAGAGTQYRIITVLRANSTVTLRGAASGGWQPVICGGQNGFVSSQYLTAASSGSGTGSTATGWATVTGTGGSGVYCRTRTTSLGANIMVVREGQRVALRGTPSRGWAPVICGGQNGYIALQYLSIGSGSTPSAPAPSTPEPTTGLRSGDHAKTLSNLNLRYSASLGSGVAAVAPAGTVVLIRGSATNGFYPVDWDGLRGYMSGTYLAKSTAPLSQRGGSGTDTSPTDGGSTSGGSSATGNAIANYAMGYQGYPYRWATHGPSSFDCSGFTYWVIYNVTGKNIWYGLWTQVNAGTPVSRSQLQPGDLVFFQNTYKAGLSHVGIYIGNNKFIHAQNEATGVVISDLNSTYYGPRWYGAVRIG